MTMIPTPLPAAKGNGKERTPEQLKAGERNFAMFQLKGMLGHLRHLHGHVSADKIVAIQEAVQSALYQLAKPPGEEPVTPKTPHLEDWSVHLHVKAQQLYLVGRVFDRVGFADGHTVQTNALIGANRAAGTVQTASGTTYALKGNPSDFNLICLRFGA